MLQLPAGPKWTPACTPFIWSCSGLYVGLPSQTFLPCLSVRSAPRSDWAPLSARHLRKSICCALPPYIQTHALTPGVHRHPGGPTWPLQTILCWRSTIYNNKSVVFLYYEYKFNHWWRTSIRVFLQTISNLLMRLIFTMVDIIRVRVWEILFSTF